KPRARTTHVGLRSKIGARLPKRGGVPRTTEVFLGRSAGARKAQGHSPGAKRNTFSHFVVRVVAPASLVGAGPCRRAEAGGDDKGLPLVGEVAGAALRLAPH